MPKENIYNVPNFLSFYRLLSFPFILYLIYNGDEKLFAILLCINLITDILDGLIARVFHLKTKFGARLDSLADTGTYILAILGLYQFKLNEIAEVIWLLWLFLALFIIGNLFSILKFKKFPSLHLYSTKIAGYVQGVFFFVLFVWGYYPILFYAAMIMGYISWLEEVIVLFLLKEMQSDAKGLYWVLKNKTDN
jgi:cardiolipin synthase (CMP-forming)